MPIVKVLQTQGAVITMPKLAAKFQKHSMRRTCQMRPGDEATDTSARPEICVCKCVFDVRSTLDRS